MKNEYKTEEKPKKKRRKRKRIRGESRVGKAMRSILDGSILTREIAVRLVPFVLLLTVLCVAYITNSYYAEKTIRQSIKIRQEIRNYESEYLSTKSELMMCSRQSELARILDSTGIKESLIPPVKIFVDKKE